VLVTHHVEEIPPGVTHAALMRNARVTAAGPISDVLTGTAVSDAFGLPVAVDQREGRWSARATPADRPTRSRSPRVDPSQPTSQ